MLALAVSATRSAAPSNPPPYPCEAQLLLHVPRTSRLPLRPQFMKLHTSAATRSTASTWCIMSVRQPPTLQAKWPGPNLPWQSYPPGDCRDRCAIPASHFASAKEPPPRASLRILTIDCLLDKKVLDEGDKLQCRLPTAKTRHVLHSC
jgi:hypothetical protein